MIPTIMKKNEKAPFHGNAWVTDERTT